MNIFSDRIIEASKLGVHICEKVEMDKIPIGQSMMVVILFSVAAGIWEIGVVD